MSLNEKTLQKNNMYSVSMQADKTADTTERANRVALTFAVVIPITISAIALSVIFPQLF